MRYLFTRTRRRKSRFEKTYCEGIIYTTVDYSTTRVLKMLEMFLDCTGKESNARVLTARFCCIRFIYKSPYLSGDNVHSSATSNVSTREQRILRQIPFPDSAFDLKDYQIPAVTALRNINIREELCIDYGFGNTRRA